MKLTFTLCCILAVSNTFSQNQSVGVGTNSPNAGAILELSSPNKSLLLPRLANNAVGQIKAPVEGMTAFDLDNHRLAAYVGSTGATVVAQNAFDFSNSWNSAGESFVTHSSFTLQNIEVVIYTSDTTTLRMDLFDGEGLSGPVIGSSTYIANGATTGNKVFTFSSANIVLQDNHTYTLNVSASRSSAFNVKLADAYPEGNFYANGSRFNGGLDLTFIVRKTGTSGWQSLLTDSAITNVVKTSGNQTIDGIKTFSSAISSPSFSGSGSSLTGISVSQVNGAAPSANPTFTGTVTAPSVNSPSVGNSSFTGNANMVAVAYGNVYSNATTAINNSSNNCTLTRNGTGVYQINLTSTNLSGLDPAALAVSATLFGSAPGFITFTSNGNGRLVFRTFNVTGAVEDRGFGFSIFKP